MQLLLTQIHIFGRPAESLARDLLLLSVAFDWSVPLRQRAHAWLELWGNALLPDRTSKYLAKQRLGLIKLVCGDADAGFLRHVVDLSALKYKQRDQLHDVFASWAHSVQAESKYPHSAHCTIHSLRHKTISQWVCCGSTGCDTSTGFGMTSGVT